jgi:hypothetical protein
MKDKIDILIETLQLPKSNVLHFHLKRKFYKMFINGEKDEEYREIKPYWDKVVDKIDKDKPLFGVFYDGYSSNSFITPILNVSVDMPKQELRDDETIPMQECYVFKIDKMILYSNNRKDER